VKFLFFSFIFCYFVSSELCFASAKPAKRRQNGLSPESVSSLPELKKAREVEVFVSAEFVEDDIRTEKKVTINSVTELVAKFTPDSKLALGRHFAPEFIPSKPFIDKKTGLSLGFEIESYGLRFAKPEWEDGVTNVGGDSSNPEDYEKTIFSISFKPFSLKKTTEFLELLKEKIGEKLPLKSAIIEARKIFTKKYKFMTVGFEIFRDDVALVKSTKPDVFKIQEDFFEEPEYENSSKKDQDKLGFPADLTEIQTVDWHVSMTLGVPLKNITLEDFVSKLIVLASAGMYTGIEDEVLQAAVGNLKNYKTQPGQAFHFKEYDPCVRMALLYNQLKKILPKNAKENRPSDAELIPLFLVLDFSLMDLHARRDEDGAPIGVRSVKGVIKEDPFNCPRALNQSNLTYKDLLGVLPKTVFHLAEILSQKAPRGERSNILEFIQKTRGKPFIFNLSILKLVERVKNFSAEDKVFTFVPNSQSQDSLLPDFVVLETRGVNAKQREYSPYAFSAQPGETREPLTKPVGIVYQSIVNSFLKK
jgi:hypothetical protein